ncbi:hypothetical protein [Mesoflavibacter profundi]|uniref:Cell surface protein n=1 Tax=Mesoflavibacter profundi TaxID=2708110 RepID=A0ABT4S361_9FLAO|nr:hypothetical protein [Mesoflavibacter profundi]MDA0178499.1 hypothetical protein [Mesoflavibacter profundi]
MKSIKLITTTLVVSSVAFMSCKSDYKTADTEVDTVEEQVEELETEMDNTTDNNTDSDYIMDSNQVMSKEYAMNDGRNINYQTTEAGIVGFDGWQQFNILTYELDEMKKANIYTKERVGNLRGVIATLDESIPSWLKTEEVMEDVADIQKEYNELMAEPNATEKEYKENLEEVSEKYADLQEELTETVEKYMKVNEKAIEKYNEQIEKGNIEKANKKYQKEIDKLNKIADYEDKQ